MIGREWTRRGFLGSLAAFAASGAERHVRAFSSETFRYTDPSTDFPVVRLTSPEHASWLPPASHRVVSRRAAFLIFSSGRSGSPQLMQMFLNTGEARQLTEVANLDPASPVLSPDDRSVFFCDGPVVRQLALGSQREREVYRVQKGWSRGRGFNIGGEGYWACLPEENGGRWRLCLAPLRPKRGEPVTLIEAREPLRDPQLRPRYDEVLYRQGEDGLALANGTSRTTRRLPLAPGRCGEAFWTSDGHSVLYLSSAAGPGQPVDIREWLAATDADSLVARTSQYASFAPNANASVFVGASANKASPYVLLLLRVARRELSLCEHRASDPAAVQPVFSPDSQRIFFQSDRDGKPAIYALDVRRLVEGTAP
jgi:oligogalacturonide lyase